MPVGATTAEAICKPSGELTAIFPLLPFFQLSLCCLHNLGLCAGGSGPLTEFPLLGQGLGPAMAIGCAGPGLPRPPAALVFRSTARLDAQWPHVAEHWQLAEWLPMHPNIDKTCNSRCASGCASTVPVAFTHCSASFCDRNNGLHDAR